GRAGDEIRGCLGLLCVGWAGAYCAELCIVSCRADPAVDPSASGGEFSQAGSVSPSPRGELVTAPLCSSLHAPRLPPAALSESHPLGDESFEKAAHLGPTSPREYADPNRARRINNKTRRLALHAYAVLGRTRDQGINGGRHRGAAKAAARFRTTTAGRSGRKSLLDAV